MTVKMVLIHANTGTDGGYVLKSPEGIGWRVPVIGGLAYTMQPIQARDVAGAEALKRVPAVAYTGMSACPSDLIGRNPYAQFLVKVRQAEPVDYDKIALLNAATGYDFIYILKYAATGAGSLNGDKLTAWLEQNAAYVIAGWIFVIPTGVLPTLYSSQRLLRNPVGPGFAPKDWYVYRGPAR